MGRVQTASQASLVAAVVGLLCVPLLPGCPKRPPASAAVTAPDDQTVFVLRMARSNRLFAHVDMSNNTLTMDKSIVGIPSDSAVVMLWFAMVRTWEPEPGYSLQPVLDGIVFVGSDLFASSLARRADIHASSVPPVFATDSPTRQKLLEQLFEGEAEIPSLHVRPRGSDWEPQHMPLAVETILGVTAENPGAAREALQVLVNSAATPPRDRLFAWLVLADIADTASEQIQHLESLLTAAETMDQSLPVIKDRDVFDLRQDTMRSIASLKLGLDGSVGSTPETALVVATVDDEYAVLEEVACGDGGTWEVTEQLLVHVSGNPFDELRVRCSDDERARSFWFDLRVWMPLVEAAVGGPVPPGFTLARVLEVVDRQSLPGVESQPAR